MKNCIGWTKIEKKIGILTYTVPVFGIQEYLTIEHWPISHNLFTWSDHSSIYFGLSHWDRLRLCKERVLPKYAVLSVCFKVSRPECDNLINKKGFEMCI